MSSGFPSVNCNWFSLAFLANGELWLESQDSLVAKATTESTICMFALLIYTYIHFLYTRNALIHSRLLVTLALLYSHIYPVRGMHSLSSLVHRVFFGRHSPQPLEVVDVAAECLLGGVHIVVGDTKLTAGLGHNGRDLGIVGLDHTREEMMRGLMVEGTWTAREEERATHTCTCGA